MDKITILCMDGKKVDLKSSLIPRMGPKLILASQEKSVIEFDEVEHESLIKIVKWIEHYKENPMKTPGQFTLSEWDDTFFKDVDAARFIDMGCTADDFFKVEGFFEYIMLYLKARYDALELAQKILLKLAYLKGENESTLFVMMECLLNNE